MSTPGISASSHGPVACYVNWWLWIGCKLSEGKDKLHLQHDPEVEKQDKNKARIDCWLKIPSMAFQKDPKAF